MAPIVFMPEVGEEEWLALSTHNLGAVWRSMPRPQGEGEPKGTAP